MPAPPIGPGTPSKDPPPQPCVIAPPPPVSDDPLVAQKQAEEWRNALIDERIALAEARDELANCNQKVTLLGTNAFVELADKAAILFPHAPAVNEEYDAKVFQWLKDYKAAKG